MQLCTFVYNSLQVFLTHTISRIGPHIDAVSADTNDVINARNNKLLIISITNYSGNGRLSDSPSPALIKYVEQHTAY